MSMDMGSIMSESYRMDDMAIYGTPSATANDAYVLQGWQCPVCKTIYAPSHTACACARTGIQQATYSRLPIC